MSQFRDLIARMAIDAEFARHARAHPDQVAQQYGLTNDEADQLRGLADASDVAGPVALGARLSKMDPIGPLIPGGGLVFLLDTDHDGIPDNTDTNDDNDYYPDTTDPHPKTWDPAPFHQLNPAILDQLVLVNPLPTDWDGDGTPDATDTDDDNDGILDPADPNDHMVNVPPVLTNPEPSEGGGGGGGSSDGGGNNNGGGQAPQADQVPLAQPDAQDVAAPANPEPVLAPAADDGGIGNEVLIVGGAGVAAGIIAGGIAGAVAGKFGKGGDGNPSTAVG